MTLTDNRSMDRRIFLKLLALISTNTIAKSIGGGLMQASTSKKMPALFIGHGSPMNAIQTNNFTNMLGSLSHKIQNTFEAPKAIVAISAHWETKGTWVTKMERPKTIHDFYGFPKALFDVQYPAPGSPETASLIQEIVTLDKVHADNDAWGLDHGTWSVIRHMYPKADIPIIQLSLDMTRPASFHFELGAQLEKLRERGVLVVGSGNIVHNLRQVRWGEGSTPHEWAIEFDTWAKKKILSRDFKAMTDDFLKTEAGKLSVPTMDHYYPLLYILGLAGKSEEIKVEYEDIELASIAMTTLSVGL